MVKKEYELSLELLSKCAELVDLDSTNKINHQKSDNVTPDNYHKELIETVNKPIDMRINQKHRQEQLRHNTKKARLPSYNESIQQQLSLKKIPVRPIQNGVAMCDFDIDEHFRKSLGVLYDKNSIKSPSSDLVKNQNDHKVSTSTEGQCSSSSEISTKDKTYLNEFNIEGYTVDDHFSKALGSDTWYKIKKKINEEPS